MRAAGAWRVSRSRLGSALEIFSSVRASVRPSVRPSRKVVVPLRDFSGRRKLIPGRVPLILQLSAGGKLIPGRVPLIIQLSAGEKNK